LGASEAAISKLSNTGWEVAVVAFFNSKKVPVATLYQFSCFFLPCSLLATIRRD
jgi:hypothetical protein